MNNYELLNLLNRFNKMNHVVIKQNLKNEIKKMGSRKEVAKKIGYKFSTFQSCLNPAHRTSLTFEKFIEICDKTNISFEMALQNKSILKNKQGARVKWTSERKQAFLRAYKMDILSALRDFKLTDSTGFYYFSKFSKNE